MAYRGNNLLLREQQRADLDRMRRRQQFADINQAMSAAEDIRNRQFERQRQQAALHGKLSEQLALKRDPFAMAPHEEAAKVGRMAAQVERQKALTQQRGTKAERDWEYKKAMDVAKEHSRGKRQVAQIRDRGRPKPVQPANPFLENLQRTLEKEAAGAGTAMNEAERMRAAKAANDVALYNDLVKNGYSVKQALVELKQMHPDLIKIDLPGMPGEETTRTGAPTEDTPEEQRQPYSLDEYDRKIRAEMASMPVGHPDRRMLEDMIQDIFAFKGFVREGSVPEQKAIDIIREKAAGRVRKIEQLSPERARASGTQGQEGYFSYAPGKGLGYEEPPMKAPVGEVEPFSESPTEQRAFEKVRRSR